MRKSTSQTSRLFLLATVVSCPRYVNSYYWTIDLADTALGPDIITSSPIYEGAHYYNTDRLTGVVLQIYFFVSDLFCLATITSSRLTHPSMLTLPSPLSSFLLLRHLSR